MENKNLAKSISVAWYYLVMWSVLQLTYMMHNYVQVQFYLCEMKRRKQFNLCQEEEEKNFFFTFLDERFLVEEEKRFPPKRRRRKVFFFSLLL